MKRIKIYHSTFPGVFREEQTHWLIEDCEELFWILNSEGHVSQYYKPEYSWENYENNCHKHEKL